MIAHPIALAALLSSCAPNIGPRTMTAIVRVESDGNPLAIHDNTANATFAPVDLVEALAWSKTLIVQHHSVDLGLAQINSANLPRLGMSLREAFDPCTNLRGGATILTSDYRSAVNQFGAGQYALRRAIGAYNTGSLFAGFSYVSKILRAAGLRAEDDFLVPDIASMGSEAPIIAPPSGYVRVLVTGGAASPTPFVQHRVPARAIAARRPAVAVGDGAGAMRPLGSPILVTVGGVNAISPVVPAAPVGTPRPAAAPPGHVPPVVLHLNAPAGSGSPFDSPIAFGLSKDGLPTSTAPIIATPVIEPSPAPAATK